MSPDQDALRRLKEADPAPPERVRGSVRQPRAQEALNRILREEPRPRLPRRRPLALVATLAAISVVVWVGLGQRPEDLGGRTAAVVLSEAAETAAGAGLPEIGPGEFLYQRTDQIDRVTSVSDKGVWTALVPRRREVWVGADGSGRILEVPGRPVFPRPRDRTLWMRAGRPRIQGGGSDREYGAGRLLPEGFEALPTDPGTLADVLRRDRVDSALPADPGLFVAAADLLSEPLVDPAHRAALYRVVAGIEGVRLLGQVTDPSGRPGVGVAITSRSGNTLQDHVLIFDAETSEVLAEEVVLLEQVEGIDADPPVLIRSRVYGASGIVSSLQARPEAV